MVIVMDRYATEEQIEAVIEKVHGFGLDVHRSDGVEQTVLGVVGHGGKLSREEFLVMAGVTDVAKISTSYKLPSRTFQADDTIVDVDGVPVGGTEIIVMAGPCSVESAEQIEECARVVARAGGRILRGGAFKPRSSPYSFQGLGLDGLRYMRDSADRYGLKIVSEVMAIDQIEPMMPYVDLFQVGARNMQNFNLLVELGRIRKPVLLKRGISATIEEWLLSAEYVMAGGNNQVILCERGIRSYDSQTRNIMDIGSIPVVKALSHLPIIADPSHATGIRDYVAPVARASVAVGADGLMVEVHPDPNKALSDGPQSLFLDQFVTLMRRCRIIATTLGRHIAPERDDGI